MNTTQLGSALVVAVLALTGCSGPTAPVAESDTQKAAATAPPEPVSAKTAFWQMYKPAYAWATDVMPLTVVAKTVKGIKNEDGKAGMWEATFASPSHKQFTKFTYSVIASPPDVRKGVSATEVVPWAGPSPTVLPFASSDWAIDSDAAFKTAMAKAEEWVKKNPDASLTEELGAANRFPGPVWYFLWGDVKKGGFVQFVSASTGKALK
jgi:hypothetical protein